jgi:hypothetical protein
MAGLVPAIHVLGRGDKKDVDARDKPGHDGESFRAKRLVHGRDASAPLMDPENPCL